MIIKNDALLATYRTAGPCEYCHKSCREREPHHVYTRGAGRLDVPCNLLSLGKAFECGCHREVHDGKIARAAFLSVVARRERVTVEVIERVVYCLRFLTRSPAGWQIREAVGQLCEASRRVVEGVLRQQGLTWED